MSDLKVKPSGPRAGSTILWSRALPQTEVFSPVIIKLPRSYLFDSRLMFTYKLYVVCADKSETKRGPYGRPNLGSTRLK